MASEIYVLGSNEELLGLVKDQIRDEYPLHIISSADIKKYDVRIVVIIHSNTQLTIETAQQVLAEYPRARITVVSNEENFELLRGLVRLGVSDYYVFPGEEILFIEKINASVSEVSKQSEREIDSSSFKRGGGKVLAFYSGNGGTGRSIISTAFAQTLKIESTASVLFIDLNLQYGGAETYLGLESNRSVVDLLPVIAELGEQHIRNVAEFEKYSNLHVLVSPRDAELAERITDDFILRLLRASKRSYDFIIVDLPVWVDERVYVTLEEAHKIYYPINADTVSLRILKNVEKLFQRLGIITENRLELVINFKGKDKELSKKDIERFVDYSIAAEIRRDKDLQQIINQGEPLRKEPKEKKLSVFAKDIRKWVNWMLK